MIFPPPLMTSDPDSFARSTIVERKPQIINQVIADHPYPEPVLQALAELKDEITGGVIQPLTETATDTSFWNEQWAVFQNSTWLQVPWYFAETYFYRRLLQATGYFQPGPLNRLDPFCKQKQTSITTGVEWFATEWQQFNAMVTALTQPAEIFEALFHSCLWGNRADLSNYTVQEQARGGLAARAEKEFILIDHTEQVRAFLEVGVSRVNFINDNVGKELLFDLVLADFLLRHGWASQVTFHLKDRPFFVSDAMPVDVQNTITSLQNASSKETQTLALRLARYCTSGSIKLVEDPFWTSCLMFRQMPDSLQEDLAEADLVILKGDVNYRRLLDDRHWPYTTPMEAITAYFPTSFVSLRTLKGEIMVGLEPSQAESLQIADPTWLINGKRGVIHLVKK